MYEITTNTEPATERCSSMKVGDLAVLVGTEDDGEIILRHYEGFVSLSDPQATWGMHMDLPCRKLKPGTVITLTVK